MDYAKWAEKPRNYHNPQDQKQVEKILNDYEKVKDDGRFYVLMEYHTIYHDGDIYSHYELESWKNREDFENAVQCGDVGIASSNAIMGVEEWEHDFYGQVGDSDPWNPRRWESYATVLSQ